MRETGAHDAQKQENGLAAEDWCEGADDWGSDSEAAPPPRLTLDFGNDSIGAKDRDCTAQLQDLHLQDTVLGAAPRVSPGEEMALPSVVPQFLPYYICVVEEEDYRDFVSLDHAHSLLKEYQQKEGMDMDQLLSQRYSWSGEPLFLTCPPSEVTQLPACSHCGGRRTFEFQLMPALVSMLRSTNLAARNHVNRMCLAADVPLIESGTAGYLGQVTTIKKGVTECYECHPKPTQRTFPGCTIRNTPSEPIHCIVWAKYLFNQLFGEEDADQEVSPDRADPEASWEPMEAEARARASNEDGDIKRISTKEWAKSTGYDPVKLFTKLFKDDIRYLLTMDKLWRKRKPPVPLDWAEVQSQGEETNASDQQNEPQLGLKDQQVLDVKSYACLFSKSIETLRVHLAEKGDGAELIWDKDDPSAMDFVTSAANLRMHIFSMNMKSRFDIKSMAGNIIPAIATTNAVIAGLIVLEGLKILSGKIDQCRTIFLNKQPNPRKKLLVPCALDRPNPNCYVCASKPEVTVRLNVHKVTVLTLQDKIVKEKFAMVAPDVQIEDGKGTILISSEEGETEANNHKKLSEFGIRNGSRLQADDFLQDYTLLINILHSEDLGKDIEFEVVGDAPEKVGPKQAEDAAKSITNGSDDGAQPSTSTAQEQDDVLIVDSDEEGPSNNADISEEERSRKRKLDEKENISAKRSRTEHTEELDDVIALD
uniref:SUMO-activating enzyme subunit 2 n=1 Tax=Canis lupus familiaris TaxID=9615 RepID=A0A8P0TUD2_CANLF